MSRLEALRQKVIDLYEAKHEARDSWAEWLWTQHVTAVVQRAIEVAPKVGANAELAEASAWLHDIADATMKRFDPGHEAESLRIARQFMQESGYTDEEIAIVVDDALPMHSCRDDQRPKTLEGQVLATADALAHLTTDYYVYTTHALGYRLSFEEIKEWTLKKSARDFTVKICFDDIRESARADYEALQHVFTRPSAKN